MDVKLVSGGRSIAIGREDFLIGRDLACHLRIDHERVHHRHCRIRRAGDRVLVEDLNSIDGTLVNDRAIRKAEARDGDRLRVGPTTFVFRIREADEARPARLGGLFDPALAAPGPRPASNDPLDPEFEPAATQSARQILAKLTGKFAVPNLRTGFRVIEGPEIAVLQLLDPALVEDADIAAVSQKLSALVETRRVRLVVDLGPVEDVSVPAVAVLAEIRDRCRARGGLLKLCRLRPPVLRALERMGLGGQFDVAPDERAAVQGPWPGASRSAETAEVARPVPPLAGPPLVRVLLIAMVGKAEGKAIEVAGPTFLIGRDPACQLRPNSPTISRLHTAIERRDGRVFVRDLGGKNGTLLNDHPLHNAEAEAAHGDRLQVGPLLFVMALGDRPAAPEPRRPADLGGSWLMTDRDKDPGPPTDMYPLIPPPPPPAVDATAPINHLSYEVVAGALMITILPADLNDEAEVAPIRYELFTLFDQPALPRRVVIGLDRVTYLSGHAIGVLLAHYQRLTRAGGNLRLCRVRPEVARTLEQMRVSMVIDIFETAKEALLAPW